MHLNYLGLPSGVLGLVLGMEMRAGLGIGLGLGIWGCPKTVVGNPRYVIPLVHMSRKHMYVQWARLMDVAVIANKNLLFATHTCR